MEVWTVKLLLIAVLKALVCSLYIVPGVSGAQGWWHSNTNSPQFMHPFPNICNTGLPLLKTSPQFSFMPMFLEYENTRLNFLAKCDAIWRKALTSVSKSLEFLVEKGHQRIYLLVFWRSTESTSLVELRSFECLSSATLVINTWITSRYYWTRVDFIFLMLACRIDLCRLWFKRQLCRQSHKYFMGPWCSVYNDWCKRIRP